MSYILTTSMSISTVLLFYSFARCHHGGKLGKRYMRSLCYSYNCTWIYNHLKIKSFKKLGEGQGSKSKKEEKEDTGQKRTRFKVFLVYHYLCFLPMVQYVLDLSILHIHSKFWNFYLQGILFSSQGQRTTNFSNTEVSSILLSSPDVKSCLALSNELN